MQNLERRHAPPSSSTTARSRRPPASASSTATRRRRPNALVLWEAQFGDFANAGQVIIDSFIVSGEAKWGQTSRLTLLLPHGYEGSGPEHSSARIERFLALGAEGNIRIANPTTAAQYFHLLRRQALIRKPRPLIVFTPKGLLRLDRAAATPRGADRRRASTSSSTTRRPPSAARRSSAWSSAPARSTTTSTPASAATAAENVAIARVELLYPFAKEQLNELIASYPNLKEIAWVQEEPRNMGAWKVMSRRMPELLPEGVELDLHRPPEPRQPRRGLLRRPRARAGAHRPHRAHTRRLRRRWPALAVREARARARCSSG